LSRIDNPQGKRRILFASHTCYFDTHNGASVAVRSLMENLARQGFATAAMTGTVLEAAEEWDAGVWLEEQGLRVEVAHARAEATSGRDSAVDAAAAYRLRERGVEVLLHKSTTTRPHQPDAAERLEFLDLYEGILDQFRPDVVVNFGGDALAAEIRGRARAEGAAVVFALHNFNYRNIAPFKDCDAITVPSRFAASYYRRTLGIACDVLPNLVNLDRVRPETCDPRFVVFVNPTLEKGVYVFARIADELGRRRPDIPLLVVEGRGTEKTLVDCGIDLRGHGNVSVMAHTPDPRQFWSVTRLCLLPSLWWENQPLIAVEAMLNGIPVIGSDRGGIPETLGDGGVVLGLPPRLTPSTRELPTAEEVAPWVKAIIALWDDSVAHGNLRERAFREANRWRPETLESQYSDFFSTVEPGRRVLTALDTSLFSSAPISVDPSSPQRPTRPTVRPFLECCIVFAHHRDDETTRFHLGELRRLNPFPVVAVCNDSPERVEGAIDVSLLSRQWADEDKWSSADSILYRWFLHGGIRARRYLILEWDTLATMPVREFYGDLWDRDVVATAVKRWETHPRWHWFHQQSHLLSPQLRPHAAGVVPLNGLLLSHCALCSVVAANPPPGIFSELRIGTLLRAAGFEFHELPPEKRRMNSFHHLNVEFDGVTPGIYHPIKQAGCFRSAKDAKSSEPDIAGDESVKKSRRSLD
jgi:glycosyltransferase involved in cell wall biosynthesis